MVLAVILGIIAGVVGFIPLVIGLKMTKKNPQIGAVAPMMKLLLGLLASFVLMFAFAILYASFDRGGALVFVLAEAIALSVSAIAYSIRVKRRDS